MTLTRDDEDRGRSSIQRPVDVEVDHDHNNNNMERPFHSQGRKPSIFTQIARIHRRLGVVIPILLLVLLVYAYERYSPAPSTSSTLPPDDDVVNQAISVLSDDDATEKASTPPPSSSTTPPPPDISIPEGRLARIKAFCGELCSWEGEVIKRHDTSLVPSRNITWTRGFENPIQLQILNEMIRPVIPVDCPKLFSKEAAILLDDPARGQNFSLPPAMLSDFTMGNRITLRSMLITSQGVYLGGTALVSKWTYDLIEGNKRAIASGSFRGSYGSVDTKAVKFVSEKYAVPHILGKRVLVVGSEKPWVESILLSVGAGKIVTLEYGAIESGHPQIETFTPDVYAARFNAGTLEPFDAVMSYSSLEHPGMGRYGDQLNPFGDVMNVARVRCVLKPGGIFIIGVPHRVDDRLYWNAHRAYGHLRLPFLFTNWEVIDFKQGSQNDIFVMKSKV